MVILLLVPPAAATDMSWTCVVPATPEEAHAYVEADVSAGDTALGIAMAWMTCPTSPCADATDANETCEEAACTTDAGAVVRWRDYSVEETEGVYDVERRTVTIDVDPPAEAWSALSVVYTDTTATGAGEWYASTWDVSWTGALDSAWPVDGSFIASTGATAIWLGDSQAAYWSDSACAWRWEFADMGSIEHTVRVGDHEVQAAMGTNGCDPIALEAWVDGDYYGVVDRDTWAWVGADIDGDGCASDVDCDETDSSVHPDAEEIPYDGIDQDCNGSDLDDVDRDGFALADDCDDTDADVHPGAYDTSFDGVDQDCDGVDATDGDRDGWDLADDCDDTDRDIHPGATEIAFDGIDQDCDGEDLQDGDGDGWDRADDCDDYDATVNPAAADVPDDGVDQDCDGADAHAMVEVPDEDEEEPKDESDGGCSTSGGTRAMAAGALLFSALVSSRRRSRRRSEPGSHGTR